MNNAMIPEEDLSLVQKHVVDRSLLYIITMTTLLEANFVKCFTTQCLPMGILYMANILSTTVYFLD